MSADDDDFEEGAEPDLSDYPELVSVSRFAGLIRAVPWFASVSEPLGEGEIDDARAFLDALGFPDVHVADIAGWDEAADAIQNPEFNDAAWEAEEQLLAALHAEALARVSEEDLSLALTHVTASASEVVTQAAAIAAARSGVEDEALIRAAAGAATQACYQAALVLAAGGEPDHPFALKYKLFEQGRWPLGIVGATFSLF